jgi:hypothetical protein
LEALVVELQTFAAYVATSPAHVRFVRQLEQHFPQLA